MKAEQRIVGIGAASGVGAMILGIILLTWIVPDPGIVNDMPSRLAYALGANVLALLPLFVMLITVGNERFLSGAIDPTKHAEDETLQINGRVADNTLQQNFVFAIASMALATVVPFEYLEVVWACAIWFIIARSAFWFGYHIHPLYRAPGMSATAYMNLGLILYTLYRVFFA